MWSRIWWIDVLERALKTFVQSLLALWGVGSLNLFGPEFLTGVGPVLGTALGAAVLSVLTSIVSAPAAAQGTASIVKGVAYQPSGASTPTNL